MKLLLLLFLLPLLASAAPSQEQSDLQAADLIVTSTLSQSPDAAALQRVDKVFADLETKYPKSAAVRDMHGSYLWSAGRKREAFATYREAEQRDGANADICLHLGTCFMEDGDTARAAGYFEEAAALAPADALLHANLGNTLYLFRHQLATPQHPEEAVIAGALRELKTAADLEPQSLGYAKGYAETFYSLPSPRWADAIVAWRHVYDISPAKDYAAINLARISILTGDRGEARRYLAKVTKEEFQPLKKKLEAKLQ
jgi:Flp pilus assembly protein TadD